MEIKIEIDDQWKNNIKDEDSGKIKIGWWWMVYIDFIEWIFYF